MADNEPGIASAFAVPDVAPATTPSPTSTASTNIGAKRQRSASPDNVTKRTRLNAAEPTQPATDATDAANVNALSISERAAARRAERAARAKQEEHSKNKRLLQDVNRILAQSHKTPKEREQEQRLRRRASIERRQREKLKIEAEKAAEASRRRLEEQAANAWEEQRNEDEKAKFFKEANMRTKASLFLTGMQPPLYYRPVVLLPEEAEQIESQLIDMEGTIAQESMEPKSLVNVQNTEDDGNRDHNHWRPSDEVSQNVTFEADQPDTVSTKKDSGNYIDNKTPNDDTSTQVVGGGRNSPNGSDVDNSIVNSNELPAQENHGSEKEDSSMPMETAPTADVRSVDNQGPADAPSKLEEDASPIQPEPVRDENSDDGSSTPKGDAASANPDRVADQTDADDTHDHENEMILETEEDTISESTCDESIDVILELEGMNLSCDGRYAQPSYRGRGNGYYARGYPYSRGYANRGYGYYGRGWHGRGGYYGR